MHPISFRMICGLALASCLAWAGPANAEVLLDEQWSDGDHTNSPTAVWSGHPEDLSSQAGSLTTTISSNSMKVWTYFVDDGNEVSLTPGESLRVTMDLSFKGALYNQTSRGYRIGVYTDPTDPQVHANINSDGGGNENPWSDATGYAAELAISKGPQLSNPIQIFKRINNYRSLLGSSGAMDSVSSGGDPVAFAVDKPYTVTFEVSCVSTSRVDLTCRLADEDGVVAQQTVLDDGFAFASGDLAHSDKPYVTFEHLFIRTNSREASADAIEYRSIKVERVTQPQP